MTQLSEKTPPEITSEIDVPLSNSTDKENSIRDNSLSKEKNATLPLSDRKFSLGAKTLGWCIFLMVVCIGLSIFNPGNDLIQNGFEAFKMFATTVLGYLFGSNMNKSE